MATPKGKKVIGWDVSDQFQGTGKDVKFALALFIDKFKQIADDPALAMYVDDSMIEAAGTLEAVAK